MVASHWGSRAWNRNLDEFAADPEHPQAFPAERAMDLMGRIRVRLRAEDRKLVAYGFGGQRIEIPASSIGGVHTARQFRLNGRSRSRALLVLDGRQRVLLHANGLWETYGEVARVCRAANLPAPKHEYASAYSRTTGPAHAKSRRRMTLALPSYQKAPGYQKLRTVPRGNALRVLALLVVLLAVDGLTAFAGVLPALALPEWIGAVRTLIGIAGVLIGVAAGVWVCVAAGHVAMGGLRWAIASMEARALAPAERFFSRRKESDKRAGLVTAAMMLGVPALVIWGPGVAIVSGVHGVSDSRLVAELRAQGVSTQGFLIDVPDYETDDNGNTTVTDVSTLSFKTGGQSWETDDPSIGGRPLPLDSTDPEGTSEPLTVVYLPGDPDTAAAEQQLAGSVWHGAPTANVITGAVLTAALPLLLWGTVRRVRRRRWLRNADLLDALAKE
jgi:hypothetical protein